LLPDGKKQKKQENSRLGNNLGGPGLKMQHLLRGLERHGIGSRALTEDDFWRFCSDEDIEIFWSKKQFAFYFTVPRKDIRTIALPSRERGLRLLFSMYHELAHHWLHGGDEPYTAFRGLSDCKDEAEADMVALVAIFPLTELPNGCPEDGRFARRLWNERLRLYSLYRI
jgi:Zn-dependent peptidase ImmA (M78 family)